MDVINFYITELTREAKIRVFNIRGNKVTEIPKNSDDKKLGFHPVN